VTGCEHFCGHGEEKSEHADAGVEELGELCEALWDLFDLGTVLDLGVARRWRRWLRLSCTVLLRHHRDGGDGGRAYARRGGRGHESRAV
jgi:hypothetical protein